MPSELSRVQATQFRNESLNIKEIYFLNDNNWKGLGIQPLFFIILKNIAIHFFLNILQLFLHPIKNE